jgi:hypothetical protein
MPYRPWGDVEYRSAENPLFGRPTGSKGLLWAGTEPQDFARARLASPGPPIGF